MSNGGVVPLDVKISPVFAALPIVEFAEKTEGVMFSAGFSVSVPLIRDPQDLFSVIPCLSFFRKSAGRVDRCSCIRSC